MTATLKILHDEHAVLASLLRTLPLLMSAGGVECAPDFRLLHDMVFYVADFPERQHHRKESDLLFPKLRARAPWSRELLDRLEDEHARGESWTHLLEHALTAWELMGEPRRAAFETAVRRYTEFYLAHMALEESDIMPLALQVLTPADWDELDQALAPEPDPLTGRQPDAAYRALFDRIAETVPARILGTVALPPPAAGPSRCGA